MALLTGLMHRTARLAGVTTLARRLRSRAVVLSYHNVVEAPTALGDPGLHLDVGTFRAQVEWLRRTFTIVPLTELSERLRRGAPVAGLLGISFDDAYRGAVRHALPWLAAEGVPVTLFVTSGASTAPRVFWWDLPQAAALAADPGNRDRRLVGDRGDGDIVRRTLGVAADPELPDEFLPATWEVLRALRHPALEFGAHSLTHRALPVLSDAELHDELRGSADVVGRELGVEVRTFAYPYGFWDRRVRDTAEKAGFRGAFSLEGFDVSRTSDPLAIPRICLPARQSQAAFEFWVSGFRHLRLKAGELLG
jgi:peptidoglycan/xylan/chitin deacetylase (PgdA/CDA1 family)